MTANRHAYVIPPSSRDCHPVILPSNCQRLEYFATFSWALYLRISDAMVNRN